VPRLPLILGVAPTDVQVEAPSDPARVWQHTSASKAAVVRFCVAPAASYFFDACWCIDRKEVASEEREASRAVRGEMKRFQISGFHDSQVSSMQFIPPYPPALVMFVSALFFWSPIGLQQILADQRVRVDAALRTAGLAVRSSCV
jgi:hypothetical protein